MIVIGMILGSVFGGIQSQYLGRKNTILTSVILRIFGIGFIRFGPHHAFLFVGQFIIGFSGQYLVSAIPAYTGELCEPKLRKLTGAFFVTFFTSGATLMYLLTAIFKAKTSLLIVLIMSAINFILVLFCPKSPTWLMSKGYKEEAKDILTRIRGSEDVANEEFKRLENNMEKQLLDGKLQEEKKTIRSLLQSIMQPNFLRPFLLLITLFIFGLQLSGATVMPLFFLPFLNQTGVSEVFDSYWAASSLTLWRLFVTIVTMMLASKIPRRPFLIVPGSITVIGWFLLGLFTLLNESDNFQDSYPLIPWLIFISVGIVMTGYSSGFCMVIFMLLGELLPSNLRGLGSGLIMLLSNLSWLLIVSLFPMLKNIFGLGVLFFFFSGAMLFVVVFASFFVPETFGLTLENIEEHYRNKVQNKRNRTEEQIYTM